MRAIEVIPRSVLLLLTAMALATAATAQEDLFEKAPPHIDKALRERVTFFYQAHVDSKFRLADTVVHEDSKDAFFAADKRSYRGFDIVKVRYEDNFKRATVVVAVQTDFFMPGAGKIPVTVPLTTFWKYDAGQWWWYVKPISEEGLDTPFGTMKPGPGGEANSPFSRLQNMPSAKEIVSQVHVDKTNVTLDCSHPASDEIVITNKMQGPIRLAVQVVPIEGFEAKLENPVVKADEEGRVRFSCQADGSLAGGRLKATIFVQPTGQQIPVRISFKQ